MAFPQWKKVLIWCVCAFGLLFSLPNILPESFLTKLPDWFPHQKVYLGLDLRGGAHLLLEVDTESVVDDYLNQELDGARTALRKAGIAYAANFPRAVQKGSKFIEFDLKDTSSVGKAKMVLTEIDSDFKVAIKGAHVTLTPSETAIIKRKSDAVERSIEIVRKRVDDTGTRESIIQRQGEDRILLQIPGLQDPSHVKELLGRTAKMTFRLVDEQAPEVLDRKNAIAPAGSMYVKSTENGKFIAVKKQVLLGGETLVDARLEYDEYNRPQVSFKFNKFGAKKFGEATRDNVGKHFAIVLDDQVISAPVIKEPIMGGAGRINSDHFSTEEAKDLSLLLRAGALPAPLTTVEERTVGPDLGADSIRSGVTATFVSIIFVLAFMLMWYSSFGMIANVAVLVNLILLVAGLSCLQATLTLPGIAGIALTVGTAVDANVLINERIKERIRRGDKWLKAVEEGYNLAMTSIIDTNLNTIIGMICLYQFGSGPVKGFAVTTMLGTIISFFTATTLTRYIITILMKMKYRVNIPM